MTTKLDDLAIFGGTPAFDEILHVGRPNIGNREHFFARAADMFDRRWLTNGGKFVRELESRLASFLGVKHCICVCNGTVALEIAIRALELQGEVIIPSFTFIATAHALQWQEITPVFCDVDPRTHNLDPQQVEGLVTPRTTGIIGVHLWGRACDCAALTEIARRRNLKLMFDAAHAFGCSHRGRMIGSFGNLEVFSFHATKFFNTFEGGAVATNDDRLAEKIRLMKNFGFSGLDNVIYIGTNGKMTEVSAAMGLTNLESLDQFIAANRENYHYYCDGLANLPGVQVMQYDESERSNFQCVVLEIDEAAAGISRDLMVRILHAENVRARRYFYPGCHQMEPYRSYFPHAGLLLPHTEVLAKRVVGLPTGMAIREANIVKICGLIRFAIGHAGEIRRRLVECKPFDQARDLCRPFTFSSRWAAELVDEDVSEDPQCVPGHQTHPPLEVTHS
jgi:dTDP-4-amino-4,6-dideoxygalactose transaminase